MGDFLLVVYSVIAEIVKIIALILVILACWKYLSED